MNKKEIDEKLTKMFEEAPTPVVRYRAEMVVGLLEELMVTVVERD
jgi:hypothetical protein